MSPDPNLPAQPGIQNAEQLVHFDLPWANLWLNRRSILLGIFGGAFLGIIVSLFTPTVYTANASFIVPHSSPQGLSSVSAQLSMMGFSGVSSSLRSPGDMYVSLLQSKTVATDLIDRFNLRKVVHAKKLSQAEDFLAGETIFDSGQKDDIVKVSVTDKNPALAADLANGYLDELHKLTSHLALTDAAQRRLFFEQQLAQERTALDNAEADLRQAQEKGGFIAPTTQTAVEIQTAAATRAQIAAREVELSGLLQGSTEQDPAVIRLRGEISGLRSQLAQMQTGTASDLSGIPASKVPALQMDYLNKQREVTYHETLFDLLARQYEAARLDESHDAPLLQVVDNATVPDTKSGPHRRFYALAGLGIGFLLGVIWALYAKQLSAFYCFLRPYLRQTFQFKRA
jgi:uncharacterized protein involved in exopolysaccharide biosynthesis